MKFHFDEDKAARAEYFFSSLTHTIGKWRGRPWSWIPWQRELTREMFGWVDADGFRKYRSVFVAIPKKNGKTDYASGVGGFLTMADNEPGAEVYSAAADREQAARSFNVFAQMCRQSDELSRRTRIIDSQKKIIIPASNSMWKVLSTEVNTKHGANISGLVFDELHAQPNRELYDILTVGTGAARAQPLHFVITTAGTDRNSICYDVWDYARKVARGDIDDPRVLSLIFELGEGEDWENPDNWAKVNPSLGHIFDLETIRDEYKDARKSPVDENRFRQLRLNQWVRSEVRWINLSDWHDCKDDYTEESLYGRRCYIGMDLAGTTDVNALVLVFPSEGGGAPYRLVCRFWVPQEAAAHQEKTYNTPWSKWARDGWVEIVPGRTMDQDLIEQQLFQEVSHYQVAELAYDEWGSMKLITDLGKKNPPFELVPMRQGAKTMSPIAKEFMRLMLRREILHDGNPVLEFMADCVTVQEKNDSIMPVKPERAKAEKIDGIMASLFGLGRAMVHEQPFRSAYEDGGVVTA